MQGGVPTQAWDAPDETVGSVVFTDKEQASPSVACSVAWPAMGLLTYWRYRRRGASPLALDGPITAPTAGAASTG